MVHLALGAMADPVIDQLEAQGYTLPEDDATRIQKLADAVTLVNVHGLIPDSICRTARRHILDDVGRCAQRLENNDQGA